jgi:hypothetical protein
VPAGLVVLRQDDHAGAGVPLAHLPGRPTPSR